MSEQQHDPDKLVLLTVSNDVNRGYLVKSILEGHGVQCVLQGDDITSVTPHFTLYSGGGVKLFVLKEQYEQAKELLDGIK